MKAPIIIRHDSREHNLFIDDNDAIFIYPNDYVIVYDRDGQQRCTLSAGDGQLKLCNACIRVCVCVCVCK